MNATGAKDVSRDQKAQAYRAIHNRYQILRLRYPVSREITYPHREMLKIAFSGKQIDTIIVYINSLPPGEHGSLSLFNAIVLC